MAKDSVLVGPGASPLQSGDLKVDGSKRVNGENGFKKRVGGRFPEVNRDLNSRLPKPTK